MSEMGNGAPLVAIGEAARIVGVSSQTLRLWGSEGLVHPVRSKGGTRYYREQDVQRLRRIRGLGSVHGLNTAAIRREIGRAESPAPASEHASRKWKTLQEVSEATGLSRSSLSTLEDGDAGASVASLNPIAKAYGTSMRELLGAGLREGSRLYERENFAGHKRQADLRVRRYSNAGVAL